MKETKPCLIRIETQGEAGVRRFEYFDCEGNLVGSSRLLGETIGDIEVDEDFRRQGYGLEILRGLFAEGGRAGYAGSLEGQRLMEKAGMREISPGRFSCENQ